MTSEITITLNNGKHVTVKPNDVTWSRSCDDLIDSCVIRLPKRPYVKTTTDGSVILSGEDVTIFHRDDVVSVKLGYNGKNKQRFYGYVEQISIDDTLTLKCEGCFHQLKRKYFKDSWQKVTLKQFLHTIIKDTDIKLSNDIPELDLGHVTLNNVDGTKVFEFLRKEYLLCAYMYYDTLYVGALRFGSQGDIKKLRIGWNVVNASDFKRSDSDTQVQVRLVQKDDQGNTNGMQKSGKYSSTKDISVKSGLSSSYLQQVLQREQNKANAEGNVGGSLECFLEPMFDIGMVADVTDKTYPDRSGKYFVKKVTGTYNSSGGRQKIELEYYGK